MANTKTIVLITLIIVTMIVLFGIIAGTSGDLVNAGNSITSASNCSLYPVDEDGARTTLDKTVSTVNCTNSSGVTPHTALEYNLPLEGLFGAGGVVMLVLMASLLLVMIFVAMKVKKGGN